MGLHDKGFPGESEAYRSARDELLQAEAELREQIERVAQKRRELPLGGRVEKDYAFETRTSTGGESTVRLSELFLPGKDTLLVYNFMYGPAMEKPCPMCTAIIDGLDVNHRHVSQRANLVVVARSPIARILDFARSRGWSSLSFLSSAGNSFNADYFGEDKKGGQWPMLNVFVRKNGDVHHWWGSELLFVPRPNSDMRHVDMAWPLWNLLDLTPEGRGRDFYPSLSYE